MGKVKTAFNTIWLYIWGEKNLLKKNPILNFLFVLDVVTSCSCFQLQH